MDDLDNIDPATLDDEGKAWLERQKGWRDTGRSLFEKLAPRLAALDPNWCEAGLVYKKEAPRCKNHVDGVVIESPLTQDNFIAIMNGPKNGDVDITALVLECLGQEFIITALRTNEGRRVIMNPNHRIELIDRITMVSFENCEDGYVTNINSEAGTLDIVITDMLGIKWNDEEQRRHYRAGQIEDELTWEDAEAGQAVGVSYLPCLRKDGSVIANVDEYIRGLKKPESPPAKAAG